MAGKMMTLGELFDRKEAEARERVRLEDEEEAAAGDVRKAARALQAYETGVRSGWIDERGNDLDPDPPKDMDEDEDADEEDEGEDDE